MELDELAISFTRHDICSNCNQMNLSLPMGKGKLRVGIRNWDYVPISNAVRGLQATIKARRPGHSHCVMGHIQNVETERWLWLWCDVQTHSFYIFAEFIAGNAFIGSIVRGGNLLDNERGFVCERVYFALLHLVFECMVDGQFLFILPPDKLRLRRCLSATRKPSPLACPACRSQQCRRLGYFRSN